MTTDHTNRWTIIGRVGLLGASAGILLGLFEAACLRLTDLPLHLNKPHVASSFWFFAPLLTSAAFGLLGLLAGFLTTLPRSRFLGMVIIAGFAGLTGAYLALVLRFSQSGSGWFIPLQHFITPAIAFTLAFACTFPALWATRKPDCPLGFLADMPQRLWSRVVFALMATMAIAVGMNSLPHHLTVSTAHATSRTQLPNIILIVWDTARADHLSAYGYFRNTTPNLDQFAQRGALFENAISASSWTLPAMSSMFTSLLPHQHGASADHALGNGPRTLAELLQTAGYETAGFNANPRYGTVPWGLARGFETYADSTATLGYSLEASRIGFDYIEPVSEELFNRSRFVQLTARQLNEQVYHWFDHRSDRPFFLFLNYNDAHDSYEVPSPYNHTFGRFSEEAKLKLLPAKQGRIELTPGQRESMICAYDDALRYIDSQTGELLQFLGRSPEWSNTYVIITSDHGEAFGEHHSYTHGWDLYREVLHVPLIVVGPRVPAGVRITHTARTRQIFATALELAGAKGDILQRASLVRLWNPNYVPTTPDEPTLSELIDPMPAPMAQGLISITTREWHFIYQQGFQSSRLYHWPTDPLEQEDVSDLPENQATVEHLKASILSIVEKSYRPWRDMRYLLAFSQSDFSPDLEALESVPSLPGRPLLPLGAGAAQTLFPPNPETPQSNAKNFDNDLLKSLPYDGP